MSSGILIHKNYHSSIPAFSIGLPYTLAPRIKKVRFYRHFGEGVMPMTLFGKSIAVVLTGVLVTAVAVALPLLPVFGEGGARRDVVLHELERNATIMDMLYLVEFEATQAGAPTSREQTIELLDKLVIPTLESLGKDGKVRAGGIVAGARAGAFVVGAKSNDEVTELVRGLPAWGIMQWKVTPLETFAHRAEIEKKVVQGLRAQK
jgi:hypothetical protein